MSSPSKLREGMIVGMGNSLLDLIGYVDDEVLDKYNLKANNGHLANEEHMPLFKELVEKYNATYVVGGSTQNTLCVTQWVLGLPNVCTIFGGIGCDEQGERLVSQARGDGVDTQYQRVLDYPTGMCAVLLTKGGAERTLVANLSAAERFTLDHLLRPENLQRLQAADIIYVSGFFLAVNVDAILLAAKYASEGDKCFAMNLSASYVAEQFKNEWLKVMPFVNLLFGNDTEARTFAKEFNFKELDDVCKIALELSELPAVGGADVRPRVVVITQGSNPVVVAADGVTKQYPVVQLRPEQVVDSTGAGDAFVGGVLAQLVQGADLQECVRCGVWCAAQIVQQRGCSLARLTRYKP